MTFMRMELAPEPHLLDPIETERSAERYVSSHTAQEIAALIRKHKRALEHEQAVLRGYERALVKKSAGTA